LVFAFAPGENMVEEESRILEGLSSGVEGLERIDLEDELIGERLTRSRWPPR
jgi:hypothetical protein